MHARNCFHSYASDVMQAINRVRTFTFLSLILQGSLWWDTKQCSNSCLRKEITSHNHCPSHFISLTTHQASHERAWGVGLHFITFRPTHENHQLASIWWVDLMKSSFQDFPIVILGISKEPVNLGKPMSGDFWKLPMCIDELPPSYLATFRPSHVMHVSSRHHTRA